MRHVESWSNAGIWDFLCPRSDFEVRWLCWSIAIVLDNCTAILFRYEAIVLNDTGLIKYSLAALSLYGELASMFPNRSGAEVVYLEQAYPRPRFLVPVSFAVTTVLLSYDCLTVKRLSYLIYLTTNQFQCHELDRICSILYDNFRHHNHISPSNRSSRSCCNLLSIRHAKFYSDIPAIL